MNMRTFTNFLLTDLFSFVNRGNSVNTALICVLVMWKSHVISFNVINILTSQECFRVFFLFRRFGFQISLLNCFN